MRDDDGVNTVSRRRTLYEALGWVALVSFLWTADTLSKFSYREQTGIGKDDFRLIAEQVTSAIAVLIMIIFVVYWLRLFPLRRDRWVPAVIGHTAGSVMFAFGHQTLMVIMRALIYPLYGTSYTWRLDFASNLIVEYQKDIKIYLGIILIMSGYLYWRRTQESAAPARATTNRLVVQTGTGEAVIRLEDIDYLEASRNYVTVHAGGREYLVRDTIGNIEKRLSGGSLVRSHRSFIVNVDRIAELKKIDDAYRILLVNGADVPLSRGYRDTLKASMQVG